MKLADRMDCLGTETAFAVSAEASNLEAKGVKIYPFHLGDINLETPKTIRSAALEAIESGKTGYCPAPGILELRKALAEDVSNSRNVNYTSNNVSVQSGGKPVISKFIMSKMNPGDRVLYPNPGYPIYESQIEFHGGIAHPYGYLDTDDGLVLDFDSIEQGIKEGAKIIFYNNYNNPTGASSSISEMKKLAALCISNDLFLFSDEAYFDTLFEGESHSIVSMPNMRERSLILYTFSKKFAMTGWRLGAAIGPSDIIDEISRLNVNDESCTTHFIQHAGVAGLKGSQDEVKKIIRILKERRDLAISILKTIEGIEVHTPVAGFYLFPKITEAMKNRGFNDLEEFRKTALKETGVSFCGRHHFGKPLDNENEHYIRLAFSGISKSHLEEGLLRFKDWIDH